jgi:phage FluMu protein gp41
MQHAAEDPETPETVEAGRYYELNRRIAKAIGILAGPVMRQLYEWVSIRDYASIIKWAQARLDESSAVASSPTIEMITNEQPPTQ